MQLYNEIENKTSNEVFNATHNKIRVDYVKDRNRGVHIFFSKVDKSSGMMESVMLMDDSNFNMLLKPMARANKKTLASVESVVAVLDDTLFNLYQKNDRTELKRVLDGIAEQLA